MVVRERHRLALMATLLGVLLCAAGPAAAAAATPARGAAASPCRGGRRPHRISHVVWIVMENQDPGAVVDNADAPYLRRLGRQCGLATDYRAITHPSLPNYVALTSGGLDGVTRNVPPGDGFITAPSVFDQLSWRVYAQSSVAPCMRSWASDAAGTYTTLVNPALYYVSLRRSCPHRDLVLGRSPSLRSQLTLILPNLCDDMHSCPVRIGDGWLARTVRALTRSRQYRAGRTVILITWDEGAERGENTALPNADHVALFAIAPWIRPRDRAPEALSHYSLLRSTEAAFGVPLLGAAAQAPALPRRWLPPAPRRGWWMRGGRARAATPAARARAHP